LTKNLKYSIILIESGDILEKIFKLGENVYFTKEDKIHFRKIIKLAYGPDGEVAVFEDGCVKKIGIPVSQLYHTIEELKESEN
jgi:hypothetical protein